MYMVYQLKHYLMIEQKKDMDQKNPSMTADKTDTKKSDDTKNHKM